MADAGWYPDAQDPNAQHYFDGQNWTGHRRPNPDLDVAAGAADATVRRGDLPGWDQFAAGQQSGGSTPAQGSVQPEPWQPPHAAQPAPPATQQWQPPQQDPAAWQYGGPQGGDGGYGPPPATPAGATSKKRTPLIIAGVAAVAVVAGVVTFLVWPGDDEPTITYGGKEIAGAADTLKTAETSLATVVQDRKGASNDDTRCYFAKPKKAASGAKKTDVENSLRCGPVLFVDGEKTAAYLRVPFTDTPDGSKVKLTPAEFRSVQPSAVSDDVELVRPDGKSAPDGSGGLSVPQPPPAAKDALVTAALSDTSSLKTIGTSMASKYQRVTLAKAGEITRYGSGDDARSAPDGQKLIAFQISYGSGDISGSSTTAAELVVDNGTPREIPSASGGSYVVAAVPDSATAKIVLSKDGYTQTLALPDGAPGSGNLAVLRRTPRTGYIGKTVSVPIDYTRGSQKVSGTFKATATAVSLDFWAPTNTAKHARAANRALLSVRLNYTDSLDPGKTFGFDSRLIRLKIGGSYVKAYNIARSGRVFNVFDVPADFKSGSLQITGSVKVAASGGRINVKVRTLKQFSVRVSG